MSNTNIVVLFVAVTHVSEKNESKKFKKSITRRNGVGWVGFWFQKPNPLKMWIGRVGSEFGVDWIRFFFELPIH